VTDRGAESTQDTSPVTTTRAALVITVLFPEPGGADLAAHLRQTLEEAVLNEIADLSDSEREGVRVTSEIEEA
jgi:hypothetical protein